jgi:hypothetical protein
VREIDSAEETGIADRLLDAIDARLNWS